MAPVECRQCGARVLARKSSWAQTSIQWDAESSAACVERHVAGAFSDAAMRHCSQLRESIRSAAELDRFIGPVRCASPVCPRRSAARASRRCRSRRVG
ncbi:ferredoxin [Nocardia sp. BSTN01]|uniref:ferredoxin n=1 Tax=Nocardia sp. BSTN01 TaxID=2783665 RepID=UPI0035CD181D